MKARTLIILAALLVCAGLWAVIGKPTRSTNHTEEVWPQRPVRIIVPLGAGSGHDLTARLFAERLAERWGKPVIVDNRPGADGIVGVSAFLAADPEETLLFSLSAPYVLNAFTHKTLPYEPQRDLLPISVGTESAGIIAATASLNITSLKEIESLARERPRQLFWTATPGFAELVFSAFLKSEKLEIAFVPYKEVPAALQDLAEGRLHLMVTVLTTVRPQVQAGKARLLATSNSTRLAVAPDLPTVTEAGYPALCFDGLYGFYGRREISDTLRKKISADIQSVAGEAGFIERLAAMGQVVRASSPEAFSERLDRQRATAARVTATLGLKPQ